MDQQDKYRIVQLEREVIKLHGSLVRVLGVQAIGLLLDIGLLIGLVVFLILK